eukprot:4448691-Pyramimonas_sp.AAC.1
MFWVCLGYCYVSVQHSAVGGLARPQDMPPEGASRRPHGAPRRPNKALRLLQHHAGALEYPDALLQDYVGLL